MSLETDNENLSKMLANAERSRDCYKKTKNETNGPAHGLSSAACAVPLETECPRCESKGRDARTFCTVCHNVGWVTMEIADIWERLETIRKSQPVEYKTEIMGRWFNPPEGSTQNSKDVDASRP